MLAIDKHIHLDESIIDYEYHSFTPYLNSFQNSDEIRIPVRQTEHYTLPSKSFLMVEGKVMKVVNGVKTDDTTTSLVNNFPAFLFDEIRYELCGTEIDRVKNVGITTTIKNLLTAQPGDINWMQNAGWNLPSLDNHSNKTSFSVCIPLKLLLGFTEDYKPLLLNSKQELVLLRSLSDKNVVEQTATDTHDFKIEISKIIWKMPLVRVEEETKYKLLNVMDKNKIINLPFRRWQLHEYPILPTTTSESWSIKTSSMIEKPRYVIIAFQTNRKEQANKNCSSFDNCKIDNMKLYLNGKYYPYDNLNGNTSLLYDMYSRFQSSYYVDGLDQPVLNSSTFLAKAPMFVIDCSNQNESLKTGSLDVRIDFLVKEAFPQNTSVYCLIIYDALVQYSPLYGDVKKIM